MASRNVTPENIRQQDTWRLLVEVILSGEAGNECLAVELMTGAIQLLNWSEGQLARLRRAVNKAALKAIQRSPPNGTDTWLLLRVLVPPEVWARQMVDSANCEPFQRPPRGWGFFLIERAGPPAGRAAPHLIELFLYLE